MRKLILSGLLGAACLLPGAAGAENQFESFAIQQAGKLLANPPLFVYEFQRNMESTTPLPPGKALGLNYHMLGGILVIPLPDLTSAYNVSAKVRLHAEGRLYPGLPQLDLVGGQWKSLLADQVEEPDASPTDSQTKVTNLDVKGHYLAAVLTSSLEPRVRLFWSYKMSKLDIDLRLNKPEEIFGTQVDSFAGRLEEHTFAAGLEHAYAKGGRWTIEGGYGLKNHLLTAKVAWAGRFMELGLNIYPESVFIMQPQVNFHVQF
jgi:hypothetical protein